MLIARSAVRLEPLCYQCSQDELLAEVLRSDQIRAWGTGNERDERGGSPAEDGRQTDINSLGVAPRRTGFDEAEQLIGNERQRCRDDAAEKYEDPILGLQPREDVVA